MLIAWVVPAVPENDTPVPADTGVIAVLPSNVIPWIVVALANFVAVGALDTNAYVSAAVLDSIPVVAPVITVARADNAGPITGLIVTLLEVFESYAPLKLRATVVDVAPVLAAAAELRVPALTVIVEVDADVILPYVSTAITGIAVELPYVAAVTPEAARVAVTAAEPLYDVPVKPVPRVSVFRLFPRVTPEIVDAASLLTAIAADAPISALRIVPSAIIVPVTVPVSPVVTTVPVVAGRVIVTPPAVPDAFIVAVPLVDPLMTTPLLPTATEPVVVRLPVLGTNVNLEEDDLTPVFPEVADPKYRYCEVAVATSSVIAIFVAFVIVLGNVVQTGAAAPADTRYCPEVPAAVTPYAVPVP
jgi:hypothetical protein